MKIWYITSLYICNYTTKVKVDIFRNMDLPSHLSLLSTLPQPSFFPFPPPLEKVKFFISGAILMKFESQHLHVYQ